MTEIEREVERQLEVMRDGAVDFYGEDELRARLAVALDEGRPLRVKLGLDPSAPDIHIGHSVGLQKLRRFQELGHTPIFLVGFNASPPARDIVGGPLQECDPGGGDGALGGAQVRGDESGSRRLVP